jgi:DNA-directed RNA polymerase subunit RPC12/RpoP
MTFTYKCGCGYITEIEQSIKEKVAKSVKCPSCGSKAGRDWSDVKIHIPESFRATSNLYHSDDASDIDYISNRLNRNRPSGKRKSVY